MINQCAYITVHASVRILPAYDGVFAVQSAVCERVIGNTEGGPLHSWVLTTRQVLDRAQRVATKM